MSREREVQMFFDVAREIADALIAKKVTIKLPSRNNMAVGVGWGPSHTTALRQFAEQELACRVECGPRNHHGMNGYFVPISPRSIWIADDLDEFTHFYVLAHETAHAIATPQLIGEEGKNPWYMDYRTRKTYGVGEVVAECSAYLATRPYIRLTNAIAPLYVASYAAREGQMDALFAQAMPLAVEATTRLAAVFDAAGG